MLALFRRHFLHICWQLRGLFVTALGWFVLGGIVIAVTEKMRFAEALYFAFITGLTVGYGDIAPETVIGRITSVLLAMMGILLSGLVVAVAVQAVKNAWEETEK
jgi:uncharacterized membrane protein